MHGGRLAVAVGAGAAGLVLTATGGAAAGPRAPVVVGPRAPTAGRKQVYVFSSAERGGSASKLRYHCSVDTPRLHPCSHRLTLSFAAGTHVLRVRATDPAGRRSPLAHVRIVARTPITQLQLPQLWQVQLDSQAAAGHNFFDVAVGATGRVYVADSAADRVDVYDANGDLAFRFGSHGTGQGEFSFESPDGVGLGGVGIDPGSGTVYVADSANGRIETFDQNGNYLAQFGSGTLGEVIDAAVAPAGTIFTVEDKPVSLKEFTAGTLTNTLDLPLHDPGGIAVRGDGDLLVPDYGGKSFAVLSETGKVVQTVTVPGNSLPSDVAIGSAGTYVTDSGEERVDVFNAAGKETSFIRTAAHPSGIALGADALYVTTWAGTLTAYQLP
jgi:sugar lactone lactonase YvrE